MPHIRPVMTSVGPLGLLAGTVFAVALISVALLTAFVLSSLPDQHAFWKGAEGIAAAEIAVALVLIFGLLPVLLLWFSTGRITVDASGMRWNAQGERGEIRWDRPFTVRRWWSVVTTVMAGDSVPVYKLGFFGVGV